MQPDVTDGCTSTTTTTTISTTTTTTATTTARSTISRQLSLLPATTTTTTTATTTTTISRQCARCTGCRCRRLVKVAGNPRVGRCDAVSVCVACGRASPPYTRCVCVWRAGSKSKVHSQAPWGAAFSGTWRGQTHSLDTTRAGAVCGVQNKCTA